MDLRFYIFKKRNPADQLDMIQLALVKTSPHDSKLNQLLHDAKKLALQTWETKKTGPAYNKSFCTVHFNHLWFEHVTTII